MKLSNKNIVFERMYQQKVNDFEKLQFFIDHCYHDRKCKIKQSYKELIYDLIEDGEPSLAFEILIDIWPKYMNYLNSC